MPTGFLRITYTGSPVSKNPLKEIERAKVPLAEKTTTIAILGADTVVENALAPAPSGEPGGVERLPSTPAGHGGAAAREECA